MSEIQDKKTYILSLRKDNTGKTEGGGPPVWLISFTDVIALMLTFFVLLYAMSAPNVEQFERKVGITTQNQAEYEGVGENAGNDEGMNINRIDFNLAEDLQYLEAIIQQKDLGDRIKVRGRGDLLFIYFDPSMRISDRELLLFLNNLEPTLESLNNRIEVVGNPNIDGVFGELQTLGRVLKTYGYRNAISVSVRDLSASGIDSRMAIAIRSNDGRRIIDK